MQICVLHALNHVIKKKRFQYVVHQVHISYSVILFYFIFIYYKKHISSATQSALEIPIQRELDCDCLDLYHRLCLIVSET